MTTIPQKSHDRFTRAVVQVLAIIDLLEAFDAGDHDAVEHARQVHDVAPEAVARLIRRELTHRVGGSATLVDLLARYEPDIITPTAPAALPPAAAQSMIAPLPATAKPDMTPTQKKYSELLREGYTPADIARILQIEPGTANTEISKARRQHGEYWYPKRNAKKPKNT